MKNLMLFTVAVFLSGCSTPYFNASEGRTITHVYSAPVTNTWRAAIVACQRPPLSIQKLDEASGTITAQSPMRMESWGEVVKATIKPVANGTEVAVFGQMRGPYLEQRFNWSYDILKTIAVELGEPLPPPPPPAPVDPALSPKLKH